MKTYISSTGNKVLVSTFSGVSKAGARNDCSVRALSNASSIPYEQAELMHKRNGRKTNCGTQMPVLVKTYAEAGFELQGVYGNTQAAWYLRNIQKTKPELDQKGATLCSFMQQNPTGKFICLVRGHAFAVVDGAIVDKFNNLANKRVVAVFKQADNGLKAMLAEMDME